jgi:TatD DNase family protein
MNAALSRTRLALQNSARLSSAPRKMGKNKRTHIVPDEQHLLLPASDRTAAIIDTHTHIASTFAAYRSKYNAGKYETAPEFVRAMCNGQNVEAVIDVWCEAPVQKFWREFADSALTTEDRQNIWGGIEYWFVMGMFALSTSSSQKSHRICSPRTGVHP